jgi:vacuolar-type H+-ATPase subunit I/STV1
MDKNRSSKQDWTNFHKSFWGVNDTPNSLDDLDLNTWANRIDDWWHKQSASKPQSVNDLYQRLRNSNQFFINFAQPFLDSKNDPSRSTDPEKILSDYLELYLEAFKTNNAQDAQGFWALPYMQWKQQQNLFRNHGAVSIEKITAYLDAFQNDKNLLNAYNQYLQSLSAYQSAFISMSLDTANKLLVFLQENESQALNIETIFTQWIEIFEREYAQFSTNDSYAQLYGSLINSWMLLLSLAQQFFNPLCNEISSKNNDEVEQLKQKQKELEEENQALREQLAAFKDAKH